MQTKPNDLTLPSEPDHAQTDWTSDVDAHFATGAPQINSLEALEAALDDLFQWRWDQNLEVGALPGFTLPPDLESCSTETSNAALELYSFYV